MSGPLRGAGSQYKDLFLKMKKRLFKCLLCAAILLTLSPAALAADEDAGFYNLGEAEGIEVRPMTASGAAVPMVLRDADGDGEDDEFYPGSEALDVTLIDTAPGELYLLTLSSFDETFYVDQQTGGGDLSFRVAFALPDGPTALFLEVGSTEPGFEGITVALDYTPWATSGSQEPGPGPSPTQPDDPAPEQDTEPEAPADYASCEKGDACPLSAFSDLDHAAWYHDGVHYVLENGIMNGVGNDRFQPSGVTSRAMLVTMLWRMEGMPEAESARFDDVTPGAWYAKAVSWAASARVVEGYDAERFGPDDPISREQLAVILWRYARLKGTDQLAAESASLGVFIDAEHVSGWALDGVQWAVNAGLITGTGNEHLSPKADAARAQVATMLMRLALLQ